MGSFFDAIQMSAQVIEAYGDAMTSLASDINNYRTSGYKSNDAVFSTLYTQEIVRHGGGGGGANSGRGFGNVQSISHGMTLVPRGIVFTQGPLTRGGPLNAAITGQSLFLLRSDSRQGFLYTRASDFRFNASGELTDSFGRRVMGYKMENGVPDKSTLLPIQLDPNTHDLADVGFEEDGTMMTNYTAREAARQSDGTDAIPEGEPLFQLAVGRVPNPAALEPTAGNAYRANITSGSPSGAVGLRFGVSGDDGFGTVAGGFEEASNVDPAAATVKGIEYQRGLNAAQGGFTMINKFLTTFFSIVDSGIKG